MFTYIMLCTFIDNKTMIKIFGKNMLDDKALLEVFTALYKSDEVKPFECVGTYSEVNYSIQKKIKQYDKENLPYLLKTYDSPIIMNYNLEVDYTQNNLPTKFKEILKQNV